MEGFVEFVAEALGLSKEGEKEPAKTPKGNTPEGNTPEGHTPEGHTPGGQPPEGETEGEALALGEKMPPRSMNPSRPGRDAAKYKEWLETTPEGQKEAAAMALRAKMPPRSMNPSRPGLRWMGATIETTTQE